MNKSHAVGRRLAGFAALALVRLGRGAGLSKPANHRDCAICGRRPDRRGRPHRYRQHVAVARSDPSSSKTVVGAGGTTGITAPSAAKKRHTIARVISAPNAASPALYPIWLRPAADFEPIGLAAGTPILISKKDFARKISSRSSSPM